MPAGYRFTPHAVRDLRSLCNYIALDNVAAAVRVEFAIYDACGILGKNSLLGSERKHVTDLPVRFWPVSRYPNYLIVYRPTPKPIAIVAILHGSRDVAGILKKLEPAS